MLPLYDRCMEVQSVNTLRLDQIQLAELTRGRFCDDSPRVMLCMRLETNTELCVFYRIGVGRQSLAGKNVSNVQ